MCGEQEAVDFISNVVPLSAQQVDVEIVFCQFG
jgi:hypothetical protein